MFILSINDKINVKYWIQTNLPKREKKKKIERNHFNNLLIVNQMICTKY